MAAKTYRTSGLPASLGEDVAEDAAKRAANRERVAKGKTRKSSKVSKDPRIADTKRSRWQSRSVARGEREAAVKAQKLDERAAGTAPENEWPKQYKSLASEAAAAERKAAKLRSKEIRKRWLDERGMHG